MIREFGHFSDFRVFKMHTQPLGNCLSLPFPPPLPLLPIFSQLSGSHFQVHTRLGCLRAISGILHCLAAWCPGCSCITASTACWCTRTRVTIFGITPSMLYGLGRRCHYY